MDACEARIFMGDSKRSETHYCPLCGSTMQELKLGVRYVCHSHKQRIVLELLNSVKTIDGVSEAHLFCIQCGSKRGECLHYYMEEE